MINIQLDYRNVLNFVSKKNILDYQKQINNHFIALKERTGKGNNFLGWISLPFSDFLLNDIEKTALKLRKLSEVCVVIGIGGSYLGARAVIEALSPNFNLLKKKAGNPIMLFAGNNISEDYLAELISVLNEKEYSIIVISKSGTTTEPAIAFRILKNHIEKKYGKNASKERIVAITDKEKGALKKLADNEGYKTFIVPDDVGGRYSVLTPVGLLPISVAGFNIKDLTNGAKQMELFSNNNIKIDENPISTYAAVRNALYKKRKTIEIMVNYDTKLFYFTEWWKQLYGESEGKEHKGIFPAGVSFTTDLHSLGQYIQEGERILFETVLSIKNPSSKMLIPEDKKNLDKLNYIAGKSIHEVNSMAEIGTAIAHVDGGVPNLKITIPEISEQNLGQLIYFYEMACAISGYILGVNPFNQPGVEAYKKNMFALLGKPGFELETENIRKRL